LSGLHQDGYRRIRAGCTRWRLRHDREAPAELAVCLYYKPADLWSIPATLKRRYPFYRLYLGHYSLHDEETVLYAVA